MERLNIGVVVTDTGISAGLAAAAARHPDVEVHAIGPRDDPSAAMAGLIVDVPLDQREGSLSTFLDRWQVPILCEMPAAGTRAGANMIARHPETNTLFSMNPLHYHLPTQRLREELAHAQDPLETVFAAWRFKRTATTPVALPQIIDYIGSIIAHPLTRVSAMQRAAPPVLLVLLRYASDVVVSLEVGDHLPETLSTPSELLIECFCRESVYHSAPEHQAIIIEGHAHTRRMWAREPANEMVSAFVAAIQSGRPPQRGINDDLRVLAQCEGITDAAHGRHPNMGGWLG